MKPLLAALLVIAAARAADEPAPPAIRAIPLPSPAAAGAADASLAAAPDGTLWLSWVQPIPGTPPAIRFSAFDAAARTWSAPRTLAADASVTADAAGAPQLALGPSATAAAIWTDGHGGARVARSHDGGATWSTPAPFLPADAIVERFSLAMLADGRALVAWLDGRDLRAGGKTARLYARVLGTTGPETLIDPAVCECCPIALTAFPDGGALLAYRARSAEEVRDIRTARFRGQGWDGPRLLNNDDWRTKVCPISGPRLANDRGRVAAAWFTAADSDPRVLATYSPDAGARFLQPLRLDRGAPAGHVDTAILSDGAMLVTWVEKDGSLWLRRVSPDFAADEAVPLATAEGGRVTGEPRLALVRDYAGGRTEAQCLVAFVREGPPPRLHTLLVTVPEGDLLSANKDCDCAPTAEQLLGLPVRGTVVAVESGLVSVRHAEIPGVLAAGTHRFRAAPEVLVAATPGREFFGRLERRNGEWRVFDVRMLAAPAK